jgi:hypothetical protein
MANVISFSNSSSLVRSLSAVRMLRLALGLTILLGALVSLLGISWDIHWHAFIGRDRTLIPPHLMILSGIALSGLAALLAVLIETNWARLNPDLPLSGVRFAEAFRGAMGAYIAGFAALSAAISFPLDSYWHALYGIDQGAWAPFHLMLILGMGFTALGAAYMLLSAARLASSVGKHRSTRTGYLAAIVAFATTLGTLTLLVLEAIPLNLKGDIAGPGFITLGNITINLFPLFSGLLGAWLLVAAASAIPWRRVASSIILVYVFFALLFTAFAPPATNWLVTIEQLSYRKALEKFAFLSMVSMEWPLAIILGAILIDVCFHLAQRRGWSRSTLLATLAVVTLLGSIPVVALKPGVSVQLAQFMGTPGTLLTLLFGLLGAFIGAWFGQRMGVSMQLGEEEA